MRIGWIATQNNEIYKRMAVLKDYTTICNSAPAEFLAEVAMRHRKTPVDRTRKIISENLNLLDKFFHYYADRFAWRRPRAGAIGFPRLIGEDVEVFCDDLVRKAGVLLLPGTVYDDPGNHFRIGFGRKNFPKAINRWDGFLSNR